MNSGVFVVALILLLSFIVLCMIRNKAEIADKEAELMKRAEIILDKIMIIKGLEKRIRRLRENKEIVINIKEDRFNEADDKEGVDTGTSKDGGEGKN